MHIITQSCVLFLWMHTLTFVKSQDCTLQSFLDGPLYDSNFDISDLAASYPGGKQVRVSCSVGYSGFFRLICVEGKWQPRGNKCQPKSCGHPGDAQFADFHLEKGEDFVFGSKVVYTCHKGYQMVSRTNYMLCMAEGWDGVVPVCEAQQCPLIHVDNNVQVNGDPEEATFGNVVRFSCKSNTEILSGATEIYCDENGDWSDKAPKCKAIQCSSPNIENGYVPGNIQVYKEHDILRFECNEKFKATESRPSKCIKLGPKAEWSPTPVCEPIRCKLPSTPLGTRYEPPYRNVFSPGDTVRVICGEKYGISNHRDTSAVTTCDDDGEWTLRPVCLEVICSNPRDNLVYYWYDNWRQPTKLDETVRYTCRSGYRSTDGATRATCTREGWRPNPLCQEITCSRLEIANAILNDDRQIYKNYEKVNYVCEKGYRGSPTRTCRENSWTGDSKCTAITCDRKTYPTADIEGNVKPEYRYNDQVEYICKNGLKGRFTLTCSENGWTGSPECAKCEKANVEHGFVLGPFNDTVYYSCDKGYKLFTKGWWSEATCIDGFWSGFQRCIDEKNCGEIPVIPNSEVPLQDNDYRDGEHFQIKCKEGYRDQDFLTCHNGIWQSEQPLETICAPYASHCNPPPKVQNAVVVTSYQKNFLSNSEVTYKCHGKYTMEGEDTIRCIDGKWETKKFNCTEITCKVTDSMPPHLNVTGLPQNKIMKIGHKLHFDCDGQYGLVGSEEIECLQTGQWNAPFPTCAAPAPQHVCASP
ncbi:complement factor H-like isoform X2 [Micropterus salmoides]|uniref:complement factor H-like isoform X2 n=1 Tax=Micropterus salmoides TaxID=27706 RepID=UPI0018EA6292|nr:complement factor H-like isoform X2 [Micropterus salmoides]